MIYFKTLALPSSSPCRATITGNGAGYIQTKGSQNKAASGSGVQGETGQMLGPVEGYKQTNRIKLRKFPELKIETEREAGSQAMSLLSHSACLG